MTASPTPKKRPKKPSPTWLTKERLTEMKATFGVVEQTIPHTFIKRDFLNCIDIVACSPSLGIVGIQATGATNSGNHTARETKIIAEPQALVWLKSGGAIEVWSWSMRGARGTVKEWKLRRSRAFVVGERIAFTEIEA